MNRSATKIVGQAIPRFGRPQAGKRRGGQDANNLGGSPRANPGDCA